MSSNSKAKLILIQEKCQSLLTQMLRDEDNKYCVDCDAKGPRWASWNLGVFLCIRCAGIHRNLGVHISRVKSVNLDTWTPEQVISLQQMGNSRARAVYEAQLPDGFRRPQTDTALESFIRAKYEQKKYLAREWVPPPLPKVDWAKEIDEELDKQKRKKKAAQASSVFGINVSGAGSEKKSVSAPKASPIPEPLAKPKTQSASSNNSPKIQPPHNDGNHTNDLLGLSSPTKAAPPSRTSESEQNMQNNFGGFLSAAPTVVAEKKLDTSDKSQNVQNLLVKEEEDFFNQGSLASVGSDKDKSQKLTKDSILALYGTGTSTAGNNFNIQMNYGQTLPMYAATSGTIGGVSSGYITATHPQQQQQQQFMTPPNSTSMYNAPVMTAPTAFTAPGMSMHMGGGAFSAQFPVQNLNNVSFPQQMANANLIAAGKPGQMNPTFMPSATTNQTLHGAIPMIDPMIQSQMSSGMSMPATNAFSTSNTASTAGLNQQFGNLNIGNVWQ